LLLPLFRLLLHKFYDPPSNIVATGHFSLEQCNGAAAILHAQRWQDGKGQTRRNTQTTSNFNQSGENQSGENGRKRSWKIQIEGIGMH